MLIDLLLAFVVVCFVGGCGVYLLNQSKVSRAKAKILARANLADVDLDDSAAVMQHRIEQRDLLMESARLLGRVQEDDNAFPHLSRSDRAALDRFLTSYDHHRGAAPEGD